MKELSNEKETASIYKNRSNLAKFKKGYSIDSRLPLFGLIEEDEDSNLKSESSFEVPD